MPEVKYTRFGPWLRDRLNERLLSLADFAALVGVQPSRASGWTGGRHLPMNRIVARIAEALELDPATVWAAVETEGTPGDGRPAAGGPPVVPPAAAAAMTAPGRGEPPIEGRPFAVWLRAELAARGWTSGLLARRLGVHSITTRRWTKGVRPPASYQVPHIAEVLGIPVETIEEVLAR